MSDSNADISNAYPICNDLIYVKQEPRSPVPLSMALVFGQLQTSAYETFYVGIWALGVSLLFSLVAVMAILLSRFSQSPKGPNSEAPRTVFSVGT